MARLNLVIADGDEAYVRSVVNYLGANYSQKFQINYFTQQSYLADYIEHTDRAVDILLVSPELFYDGIPRGIVKAVAILSEGMLRQAFSGYDIIDKYQTGDKLASSIIAVYSRINPDEILVQSGSRGTRAVAVYSPAGGCGKTSIALGLAICSAGAGMKTFYLNLEQGASTPLFFECGNERNMSHLFYFLREKNKNLGMKIEGVRVVEPHNGIHYFCPPESTGEYGELQPEELVELIAQLRQLGQYDVVFVDMDSGIYKHNMAVLEACDEILMVLTQEAVCRIKLECLEKELDIIRSKGGQDISDKLRYAVNKYNPALTAFTEAADIYGQKVVLKLPKTPGLLIRQSGKWTLDLNNEFGEELRSFVQKYRGA